MDTRVHIALLASYKSELQLIYINIRLHYYYINFNIHINSYTHIQLFETEHKCTYYAVTNTL